MLTKLWKKFGKVFLKFKKKIILRMFTENSVKTQKNISQFLKKLQKDFVNILQNNFTDDQENSFGKII